MADSTLRVVLAGDTRQLDRALNRTETRLKKFGRTANAVGGGSGVGKSGILGLATKSNLAVAGVSAVGLGLVKVTQAANNANLILAQTGNTVKQAGIDWGLTSQQITDSAKKISRASSFDDEAVLQSFQVFVRGQKDVAKSLELSQLAADVARGRYTDLASATQLVNKAAMGQIGALRRAGIQIDKNATSTQALEALTRAYAGSANTYAASAQGGIDRLKVSWDNLLEDVGQGSSGGVNSSTGFFASLIDWTDKAYVGLSKYYQRLLDVESRLGIPGFGIKADTVVPFTGTGGHPDEGTRGRPGSTKPPSLPTLITQIPNRLIAEAQRAQLAGNTTALRAVLEKEQAVLKSALNQKGLKPGQVVALQGDLIAVGDAITAIDDQIAADAADKKQAAMDAKDKMKAAHQKAVDALKAQSQAFADQASAIKSAVLDQLDAQRSKITNNQDLADANRKLRFARQLGGPEGIKMALRDVGSAKFAIQRQGLEAAAVRMTEGPKGPIDTLRFGSIVVNINGAQNPDLIAKQVIAAIRKGSKQNAGQSRGRHQNIGHL